MSWLCDTTELVPGAWLTSKYAGHGVLAEDISSSGLDGPSALFGAVSLPADNGKEIRGYLTRWPTAPLSIEEDGTFTYGGGPDYFEFSLFESGTSSTTDIGFGPGISKIWLSSEPGGEFLGTVTLDGVSIGGSFRGSLENPSAFSGSLVLDGVALAGSFEGVLPPSGAFSGAIALSSALVNGVFGGGAASNIGRPAQDISNTGWAPSTGTELYPLIGEAEPNSSTYIVSTAVGQEYEVALSPTNHPGSSTQFLRFRGSSNTGNSVIVRLKNLTGDVVLTHTQVLTPTDTEYSIGLTTGQIAAITSGALSVVLESA